MTGEAIALAEAGKGYVVYLPHGGVTTLDVVGVRGEFISRWFNPRSGKFGTDKSVERLESPRFIAPDASDWVLLVERVRQR